MQLTDKQCWETLRKMVADKNSEFRLFLHACFGSNQVEKCNTYTSFLRDTFLAKMGLNIDRFKLLAIKRGQNVTKSWDWINSLSSEDMLLYYDFQCRALQGLYNKASSRYFYTKTNPYIINDFTMYGRDIAEVIGGTVPVGYARYKGEPTSLLVMGKPDSEEGEEKADVDNPEVQKQALSQIMGLVHYNYAISHHYRIENSNIHQRFITSNNCGGEILGVNVISAELPGDPTMKIHKASKKKVSQPKITEQTEIKFEELPKRSASTFVGFTKNNIPIIKMGDKYFDGFGDVVTADDIDHTL